MNIKFEIIVNEFCNKDFIMNFRSKFNIKILKIMIKEGYLKIIIIKSFLNRLKYRKE